METDRAGRPGFGRLLLTPDGKSYFSDLNRLAVGVVSGGRAEVKKPEARSQKPE
jgi:hypothetical protein